MSNGSPKYIQLGIEDLSITPKVVAESSHGQHLTKFFIMSGKGRYGRNIMSGGEALAYYGGDTFSKTKPFFTPSTAFLAEALSVSKAVIQRIDMGGSKATLTQYIDIATETRTIKKRLPSGGIDPLADDLKVDVPCYKLRLVSKTDGIPVIQEGTMKNVDDTPSKMYPIYHFESLDGEFYNTLGFKIGPWTNLTKDTVRSVGQYLYGLTHQNNVDGFITSIKTIAGSESCKVGLADTIDPITEKTVALDKVFQSSVYNTTDRELPLIYPDTTTKIFEENFRTVAKILAINESNFINGDTEIVDSEGTVVDLSEWYDVTGDLATFEKESPMLNIITSNSTAGVQYQTIRMDDTSDSLAGFVVGNSQTLFQLGGGTDFAAELDTKQKRLDHYHSQIIGIMAGYTDINSQLQETVLNPESNIYDPGFPLEVKKSLINFISVRHDTVVVLSTYICGLDGETHMTPEDEVAIGTLLKGRLDLNPESTEYATPIARGVICGGYCQIAGSDYREFVPTTFDLMSKMCNYMGAGNKEWNELKSFDAGAESVADTIENIFPVFVSPAIKGKLWAIGINWLEVKDKETEYHWPAFSTVASDRSSLNSIFTVQACAWIEKVHISAWKEFTGETRLTRDQFKIKQENYVSKRIRDAFDGRFALQPKVFFTDYDDTTRYSYHLTTRIGTNDMLTVVRTSTQVVRKSDF